MTQLPRPTSYPKVMALRKFSADDTPLTRKDLLRLRTIEAVVQTLASVTLLLAFWGYLYFIKDSNMEIQVVTEKSKNGMTYLSFPVVGQQPLIKLVETEKVPEKIRSTVMEFYRNGANQPLKVRTMVGNETGYLLEVVPNED